MGGGDLVRDSNGHCLVGFMRYGTRGTTFWAEAKALKEGLWLAWTRGF